MITFLGQSFAKLRFKFPLLCLDKGIQLNEKLFSYIITPFNFYCSQAVFMIKFKERKSLILILTEKYNCACEACQLVKL